MATKVKFVEYGERAKVKIVEYGEDMKVIPVQYGEEMKVKVVQYGEQFKVKIVQDTNVCFITTACVEANGLPDDCPELTTVRAFRDGYIKGLPNGKEILGQYYEVAPQILAGINRTDNRQKVYLNLYEQLVSNVELIRSERHNEALKNYLRILNELKLRYL